MARASTQQVLARKWKYAAPRWRVYEALVDERDRWLETWDGEQTPQLIASTRDERVVLAPWVDHEIDHVEVLVTTERADTKLLVLVHADHELTPGRRKEVKYRVGTLFGEALRSWVDGW